MDPAAHPVTGPGRPQLGTVCMGCTEGITVKRHQCAGDKELLPYGGTCQCRRAGCRPGGHRTRSDDVVEQRPGCQR
ncbi:hypothetical protein [Micromonospora marina]|uniref:hypothetical protein n=1 Tax=Micromonospora marina TaxID=307120 RepID=UPI003453E7C4